jgi:hypothetical protein
MWTKPFRKPATSPWLRIRMKKRAQVRGARMWERPVTISASAVSRSMPASMHSSRK